MTCRVSPATRLSIACVLPAALLVAPRAAAHEKDFTRSIDWELPSRGEREFEGWTRFSPRSNDLEQLLKFEYGVTDHFAIEPAVEFTKANADAFKLEAAELEAYVNFRDFGFWKLLPALEGEIERVVRHEGDEDEEEARASAKLHGILSVYSPDGEDFTINLAATRHLGGDEGDWEGEFTAGYLRPLDFIPGLPESREHPLKIGMELAQSLSGSHGTALGPVLTWRATENLHVVVGGTVALSDRGRRGEQQFDELRLILEWEF